MCLGKQIFTHGFLTLEDDTIVTYLVKGKYNPNQEKSIVWKDIPHLKNNNII